MMNFKAGNLVTREGAIVGEYWTCEAVAMHHEICISWGEQSFTMDKSKLPDWAQLHGVQLDEKAAPKPYIPALDLFDVGFDIPWDAE